MKTKINKLFINLDLIKQKSFCTAKETINKTKRQPIEQKIFVNGGSDKGLLSKLYKEVIQFNFFLIHLKNGQRTWMDISPKETYKWLAKRHMKRCSKSLIIMKMQIKITTSYHLTPVRMAVIKKTTNNNCWWEYGEKGTLEHYWLKCKLVYPLWKTTWRVL